MEFTVTTAYDPKALTAMAKGLRKSIRKKHSRRSHILGVLVILLGLLLILNATEWNSKTTVTAIAVLAITVALVFEDRINGYVAWKRGIPGLNTATVTFREDGYHSATEVGESDFSYSTVRRLVRVKDYLIFVIGPSHGQVYDLRTVEAPDKLIHFLEEKTECTLETV